MASAPAADESAPQTSLPIGLGLDIESFIVNDVPANANERRFDVEALSAVHDDRSARLAALAIGASDTGGGHAADYCRRLLPGSDTEVQRMRIGD